MATCERKTETPPPTPPATYVLTLSEREAASLMAHLELDWEPAHSANLYAIQRALRLVYRQSQ